MVLSLLNTWVELGCSRTSLKDCPGHSPCCLCLTLADSPSASTSPCLLHNCRALEMCQAGDWEVLHCIFSKALMYLRPFLTESKCSRDNGLQGQWFCLCGLPLLHPLQTEALMFSTVPSISRTQCLTGQPCGVLLTFPNHPWGNNHLATWRTSRWCGTCQAGRVMAFGLSPVHSITPQMPKTWRPTSASFPSPCLAQAVPVRHLPTPAARFEKGSHSFGARILWGSGELQVQC